MFDAYGYSYSYGRQGVCGCGSEDGYQFSIDVVTQPTCVPCREALSRRVTKDTHVLAQLERAFLRAGGKISDR